MNRIEFSINKKPAILVDGKIEDTSFIIQEDGRLEAITGGVSLLRVKMEPGTAYAVPAAGGKVIDIICQ